ncbi:PorP/SprF family type IX secretion system membrane protein [Roseivirga spongicola]|uniref:PorP/SprF family type IX secretion system membrane protein n=1 Tax=Roseivirga spongicola TaxID=333140 RepID=UPI002AC90894|nr:PorP/SprF family type IX secretion system membrane protein [Roseivirga spongicola]WPZ11973.1 PorP/SprF family type IX secretion system membrane protein [Roseivirga spongicola]
MKKILNKVIRPTFVIRSILITTCMAGLFSTLKAQDPHFSQFYSAPIYINPALAGQNGKGSLNLNSRQQWTNLNSTLFSNSLSADHFLPKYNSSIGVILNYHQEDLLNLISFDIGTVYSYSLKINETLNFRAGLQASYFVRDANFSNLIFGDQLDITTGTTNPNSQENLEGIDKKIGNVSFSTGGMLYRKKHRRRNRNIGANQGDWWVGTAFHHINEPNQSIIENGNDDLSLKMAIQTGIVLSSKKGPSDARTTASDYLERSWTFIANWKKQRNFSQLDLGLQYFWEPILLGINYRGMPTKNLEGITNQESLILIVGVDLSLNTTVGFSHDFPISKLSGESGGSSEISLSLAFSLSSKPSRKRVKTERVCAKR